MNCEMDYLQFADWSADNIDYSRQASRIETWEYLTMKYMHVN